jgi:hypothetical protein
MKKLMFLVFLFLVPTVANAGPAEDLQCAAYFTYAGEVAHRAGDLTNERADMDVSIGLIARAALNRSDAAIDAVLFQNIEAMRYQSQNLADFDSLEKEFASPCQFLTRSLG